MMYNTLQDKYGEPTDASKLSYQEWLKRQQAAKTAVTTPGTITTPVVQPKVQVTTPETTAPGTQPFYSPELEKLKHSYLTKDYGEMPEYFGDIKGIMKRMGERTETPVGLSDRERQSIYNLGRKQVQSATKTAMEQMTEKLSGAGFRPGESGIADAILAGIAREGTETLGKYGTDIAISEAKSRFPQAMALEQLNLQKGLGAGSLTGLLEQIRKGKFGEGLEALKMGGGLEQFGKAFGLEEGKFEYGQEMDAIQLLMQLFGGGMQQQQQRYDPYYRGIVEAYS